MTYANPLSIELLTSIFRTSQKDLLSPAIIASFPNKLQKMNVAVTTVATFIFLFL